MSSISPSIPFTLPEHKLNPPAYAPVKISPRHSLLDNLKHLQAYKKKIILIEARAGSGKSIFAQQYLQEGRRPFGWYQLGPEDHDPVALLNLLVVLLQRQLPGFQSENVANALNEGAIHYREVAQFGKLLAQEMENTAAGGFHLVFDDVHLLDGAGDSINLLRTLLLNSPSWFQWILVSRHSIKKTLHIKQFHTPTLLIENEELDFSLEESMTLFETVFKVSLPFEQLRQIHQQTEGWITGLVLCAMQVQNKQKNGTEKNTSFSLPGMQRHLADYFKQDVLSDLHSQEIETLLQMILLEDFSTPLLNTLFGSEKGELIIRKMQETNRFFRCLDEKKEIYSFHHLFRESLLPIAQHDLSGQKYHSLFLRAAQYHLSNNEPLRALLYAVRSDDLTFCESILRDFGLLLLHRNQVKTLHTIIGAFPEQTIHNLPWLSFFYGTCVQDSEPTKALPYLEQALKLFSEKNDKTGMIVSNSQLIEYHTIIDARFNLMVKYIDNLERIYCQKKETLPLSLKLRTLYSLSMGLCFLQMDLKKVKRYDTQILDLSIKNNLDNLTAMTRLTRAYRHCFVGHWDKGRQEVEASRTFLYNPRVATLTRVFLGLLQVNILEMTGDFTNYLKQKQLLEQTKEQDILIQSIIGPLLAILNADMMLAQGNVDAAESFILDGMQGDFTAQTAHMQSQFLQYQALILALKQKKNEALKAIHKSLELRRKTGANSFIILNHQIIGAAFAHLGLFQEADDQFSKALKVSSKLNEEFSRSAIFAHRAWMRLQNNDETHALEDIRHCLRLMDKHNYKHFFSFLPQEMIPICKLAIKHDIETKFTTRLLAEQLKTGVTPKGSFVPRLAIRFFGRKSTEKQDRKSLHVNDLNPKEKALIFMIIGSPENQIDRHIVSEQLWPEKTETRQRISLDVLLSHLRKKIGQLIAPVRAKEYLTIVQGIIKLRHCQVDIQQFLTFAEKGKKHMARNELWQADNNYYLAFHPFIGENVVDSLRAAPDTSFAERVEKEFRKATTAWASILIKQNQAHQAGKILEWAFQQIPFDFQLAKQLFLFHTDMRNHHEAKKVTQRYRKACRDNGYSLDEIETAINGFWEE